MEAQGFQEEERREMGVKQRDKDNLKEFKMSKE